MVFDAFVGARRAGNRRRISERGPPTEIAPRRTSLACVTEPGTVGSGIELATVLSFIDIAVDALAGAREEIDALNVYPVPDGDTGTNMYLTMAAARDAVREKAAAGDADRAALFEAFTRGALLGARGNSGVILSEMLRAIMGRIAEAQRDERNGAVMVDALQARDRGELRSGGHAGRGHDALGLPRCLGGGRERCSRATRRPGRATCSPPARPRRARPWPARPTSSRSSVTQGWSTPAAAASW